MLRLYSLFLLAVSLLSVVHAQTYPPKPANNFGVPYANVWGPGSMSSAGTNPLNGAGNTGACTNGLLLGQFYYFNVLENYQQVVTFFPSTCTGLSVKITSIPSASTGTLYQYSAASGRSYPVTAPTTLPTNMILYQPALNSFSVYDGVRTPALNSTLSILTFQIVDTSGAQPTYTNPSLGGAGSQVQFWVLWQNQPPTTTDITINLNTATAGYQQRVISLAVSDPDLTGANPISQTLTAYIATLPTAGNLYQYDGTQSTNNYHGNQITTAGTAVVDSNFRVVFEILGTGRPYGSFTYSADDTLVDNIGNGLVTINVLVNANPTATSFTTAVDENGQLSFVLQSSTDDPSTQSLNRATIETLPSRGSLFQVLPSSGLGQRISSVPTVVADLGCQVWFKPDPYTTSSGATYTTFTFSINNGLNSAPGPATVTVQVNDIHLPPFAQNIFAVSTAGNDVAVRFIGSTLQPSVTQLYAYIQTLPARGTLKQGGSAITGAGPIAVTDITSFTVSYSPEQSTNPSVPLRYTTSFQYFFRDISGGPPVDSALATATIQVGSAIRPPLVYNMNVYTLQNQTLIIQLNGTVQDTGDTLIPFITRLPSSGALYQMVNAQQGLQITGTGSVPVADPNYYIYFVPDRFSPANVTFDFVGFNSENLQSTTTATVTINVGYVPFAPTVPAATTVTTQASQSLVINCPFFAGPTPPPIALYITQVPAAGSFYQWDTTVSPAVRGSMITATAVSAAQAGGLPGVMVSDPNGNVQFDPPPYEHGPSQLNYAYAQFQYIASDITHNNLLSPAKGTVTIAVTQVNFPPIVRDAAVTTLQETSITIYLSSYVDNPSKIDGNVYVCIIASLPTQGTLYQVDSNGKPSTMIPVPNVVVSDPLTRVIYKPKPNIYGANLDNFKFFAEDPDHFIRSIRIATLTLSITFVNKPPKANNLDARMYENQAKVISLAAVDPEGGAVTTFIMSASLPRGMLFQFVNNSGSLPANTNNQTLSVGGADNDPEVGQYWTLANYTGRYGGGFDYTQYIGAPITAFPTPVYDSANRVVFLPQVYDHGNAAYDYIYGNPQVPGEGTFTYIANDGMDNSTSPGTASVKVETVVYAPIAYTQTFDMDEDSFLIITLPIRKFDVDEQPPCYILTVPTVGDLYQYDGRNPVSPKAEQILSKQTQVQDINPDGTPGNGRTVVYEPPKLQAGLMFANFSFYATNSKDSNPGMVWINVNKVNHKPTADSFNVILSGHNRTTPVTFNVTDVDFDPVYVNITGFPTRGALWSTFVFNNETATNPSGFNTWTPVPGTILTTGSNTYYPPYDLDTNIDGSLKNTTRNATRLVTILFDDFNMGGMAVTTGCVRPGTTVACGYTNFTFRLIDSKGAYSDGFVEVQIQCGPSYVVNTWESVGPACITCPIGAICPTEGQFTPMPEPGYWRGITPTGLMFVACNPSTACMGINNVSTLVSDLDAQCAPGYYGRMCAACMPNYYKLNSECKACSGRSEFWLVIIGVPTVLILLWFVLHVSRRGVDLTFFAIVLTYCQILSIYSQYKLTWPESVMTALTVFSITHLNLDIFAVSCYYNTGTYSDKWKAKMAVIPGFALAVVGLVLCLIALRSACGKLLNSMDGKKKREDVDGPSDDDVNAGHKNVAIAKKMHARPNMNRMVSSGLANYQKNQNERLEREADQQLIEHRSYVNNDPSAGFDANTPLATWIRYYLSLGVRTFTLLLFVAYLPICTRAFQLFNCTSFPDGSSTFDDDPSLECYTSWWNQLYPYGIVAVIIYGAGIPAWFVVGLAKTAPKFDMVQYWLCFYYPKVRSGEDQIKAAAEKAQEDMAAKVKPSKRVPPPPNSPPEIPAPSKEATHVPHLHAATVHALEQARAGQSEDDLSARKAKLEEDDAAVRAKREAGWAFSENLALTSAESDTLTEQQKIARFMFTLVIDPFRDDLFFWMIVILLRSFLLSMVSIFFADEPVYQATLALLVLFLYTLGTAYFQPYVNPTMNKLEFVTMSCACLVLFNGFLFVGESNKQDTIFTVLAVICLFIICISFVFVGKVVFAKLEETFHCWNCRKVPVVAAPSFSAITAMNRVLRSEILAAHEAGQPGLRVANDPGAHSFGNRGSRSVSAPRDLASPTGFGAEQLASPSAGEALKSGSSSSGSRGKNTHYKIHAADGVTGKSREGSKNSNDSDSKEQLE